MGKDLLMPVEQFSGVERVFAKKPQSFFKTEEKPPIPNDENSLATFSLNKNYNSHFFDRFLMGWVPRWNPPKKAAWTQDAPFWSETFEAQNGVHKTGYRKQNIKKVVSFKCFLFSALPGEMIQFD